MGNHGHRVESVVQGTSRRIFNQRSTNAFAHCIWIDEEILQLDYVLTGFSGDRKSQ